VGGGWERVRRGLDESEQSQRECRENGGLRHNQGEFLYEDSGIKWLKEGKPGELWQESERGGNKASRGTSTDVATWKDARRNRQAQFVKNAAARRGRGWGRSSTKKIQDLKRGEPIYHLKGDKGGVEGVDGAANIRRQVPQVVDKVRRKRSSKHAE